MDDDNRMDGLNDTLDFTRTLRKRLIAYVNKKPASPKALAQKMGIAQDTLIGFLLKTKKTNLLTCIKIESFLKKEGYGTDRDTKTT